MITLEEAFKKIDEAVTPLPPRNVSPLEAVGCAVAQDIVAEFDVPGFASAAMDGIALSFEDLKGGFPQELTLQGIIPAGQPAEEPLKPGHAFRIMTGAALPQGADTVIKVEELEFIDNRVLVSKPPGRGDHVRPTGNDIRKGEVVFPKGTVLKKVDAGICSTLGLTEISVNPKPKIAIMATGSEIRPPGEALKPGQIYNSNDTTLRSMLVAAGYPDPGFETPAYDDPKGLTPTIERLCQVHDMVITSGAVSMGEFDFIPDVVERLGGEVLFHKAFVKPGKPTLIARLGKCWLLGLPGNPVSVLVTYHLYGKRLIARLMGQAYEPKREKATVTEPFTIQGERSQVWGAHLRRGASGLEATPVKNYTSGRLSAVKGIDGFIVAAGGSRTVARGTIVDVEWV